MDWGPEVGEEATLPPVREGGAHPPVLPIEQSTSAQRRASFVEARRRWAEKGSAKPKRPIRKKRERREAAQAEAKRPTEPQRRLAVVSARNLHSDKHMEEVPQQIEAILLNYFGFQIQTFHKEALEACFQGGKRVVNWPTDHAKSWMFTRFFPELSLMNNPDESHILCGANERDAKRRVQVIQRDLEGGDEGTRRLIKDYPWVKRPGLGVKSAWSTTELTVAGRSTNKPDPSVVAIGAGSDEVRTRRGKFIGDDLEGSKHKWSPQERDKLLEWVSTEIIRCYEDARESERPLLLLCGTPFTVDSLYFKLAKRTWTVDRRMVYLDPKPWSSQDPWDHVPPHADQNYMLWPEKFEKVHAQFRSLSMADFALAYLMDPTQGDPSRLTMEQIDALTEKAGSPEQAPQTFVSLDAASGSTQMKADYAGISVVRIAWPRGDPLPQTEVLEARAVREGLFEQVAMASQLARDYSCDVICEVDGLGSVYRNAFAHLAPDINVIPTRTRDYRLDTEMGITVVRTLVGAGKLRIPTRKGDEEGFRRFKAEIRDLGGFGHDHICASVWFPLRWVYRQIRAFQGPAVVNGWNAPYSGTLKPTGYIDREPVAAAEEMTTRLRLRNGWAGPHFMPYRRFN